MRDRFSFRLVLPCAVLLIVSAQILAGCGPRAAQAIGGSSASGLVAAQDLDLTYVAIGASDAYGIGTDSPAVENWPSVLAAQLGGPVHLINLGIPGETVAGALTAEAPIALDARPDLITIWLAVNDLENNVPLATYRARLYTLLATLRQGTAARIFVGNLPDLTLLPYFSDTDPVALTATVRAWNAAIAADCAATGAHLVDLYADWSDLAQHPEYISADGLHPSTLGAARLAAIFAAAIKSASLP